MAAWIRVKDLITRSLSKYSANFHFCLAAQAELVLHNRKFWNYATVPKKNCFILKREAKLEKEEILQSNLKLGYHIPSLTYNLRNCAKVTNSYTLAVFSKYWTKVLIIGFPSLH